MLVEISSAFTGTKAAYDQAVHELHKEIVSNAENSAAQLGTVLATGIKNATNANYIADVKNAAVLKIENNNKHVAELNQHAKAVNTQNPKIAAKANEYLSSAVVAAGQQLHIPGYCFMITCPIPH